MAMEKVSYFFARTGYQHSYIIYISSRSGGGNPLPSNLLGIPGPPKYFNDFCMVTMIKIVLFQPEGVNDS